MERRRYTTFSAAEIEKIIMDNDLVIARFKARLLNGDSFFVNNIDQWESWVETNKCRIKFMFDRYGGGGCMIMVSDPNDNNEDASFIYLRYIRGARDVFPDIGSPENTAEIFNKYFSDVLGGDFSILKEYYNLAKDFPDLLMDALCLDDDDPIKVKTDNWDISFLDDLRKGR